jgi:hypothetical protein
LVARDSVTGGHKEIADREFRAAETWRRITIASLVVAAAWITFSLFFTTPVLEPERAFWLGVGKSISLTVLLVSFAVYASKQASIHRLNERKARAFFLQVQAFDPFIASLPEETRVALKQALSSRIFGADDSEGDKQVLEAGELKTFDRFLDLAERLKKLVIR